MQTREEKDAIVSQLRAAGATESTIALMKLNLGIADDAMANAADASTAATAVADIAAPIVGSIAAASEVSDIKPAGDVGNLAPDPALVAQPAPTSPEIQAVLTRLGAAEAAVVNLSNQVRGIGDGIAARLPAIEQTLATLGDAVGLGDIVRTVERQVHDRVSWLEDQFENRFGARRVPPPAVAEPAKPAT